MEADPVNLKFIVLQVIPATKQCNKNWDDIDKQVTDIVNNHATVMDYFDKNREDFMAIISRL